MGAIVNLIGVFLIVLMAIIVFVTMITTTITAGGWQEEPELTVLSASALNYTDNLDSRSKEFEKSLKSATTGANSGLPFEDQLRLITATLGLAISPLIGIIDLGAALINAFGGILGIPYTFLGAALIFLIFYVGSAMTKAFSGGGF